ncbi:PREDICTED: protein rolling stone-like isoform X2 [Ceratosolen solmsi marchali]|uniref:Protein rolling stone-like isoform X2 n=1 Tax=Ceratosolen solmsi marchali TaxID=326594 RepID=A0AAJ6YIK8_9HYME|nr:PREDICTED: protein rolling stone-like isoform X2 [Ceratosolen solmsi marchali]
MAIFTFRKFPSPNVLLLLLANICSRRRAMVKKVWCRELFGKFLQVRYEPTQARYFSEPKCQDTVRLWYLAYRYLIFCLWLLIILCSVFEIGSVNPLGLLEKWPIYLTNWDLILGLVQSFLACVLVTRRSRYQEQPGFDASSLYYGKLEKFYWFMYVVTSSLALGVTITYWALIHDPAIHHVDVLNILIHVANSLLMIVDLCVTSVPFEFRCFWWCPFFVNFYLIFSIVYYLAGGLDKNGQHRIYNILDWEKPIMTLLICAGGLTFLVITHCLLCILARLRNHVYERRRKPFVSDAKNVKNMGKEPTYTRKNESCV